MVLFTTSHPDQVSEPETKTMSSIKIEEKGLKKGSKSYDLSGRGGMGLDRQKS